MIIFFLQNHKLRDPLRTKGIYIRQIADLRYGLLTKPLTKLHAAKFSGTLSLDRPELIRSDSKISIFYV